jgi:hypothetical protein
MSPELYKTAQISQTGGKYIFRYQEEPGDLQPGERRSEFHQSCMKRFRFHRLAVNLYFVIKRNLATFSLESADQNVTRAVWNGSDFTDWRSIYISLLRGTWRPSAWRVPIRMSPELH